MKFAQWLSALTTGAGLALLVSGCEKPQSAAAAPATNAGPGAVTNLAALYTPTNAQPKLPTIKLWVGSQELETEQAVTLPEVMTGMMFRKSMGEHEAMLFIFTRPHRASFFMRNTSVPLSCAYIDSEGTILELHDMKPLDETPIEASSGNVQYVLEVKQGWFERNKVGVGAVVRTELGSLRETYFRRR
jgi:uncharacterized protein